MVADLIIRWRSSGSFTAYTVKWFIVDLAGALPLGLMTGIPVLEVLRLIKLARVVQTMQDLWSTHIDKWNTFRLVYSAIWIGLPLA